MPSALHPPTAVSTTSDRMGWRRLPAASAAFARSAYVILRPGGPVITPSRTSRVAGSTVHCRAASAVKSSRAVAAARRISGTSRGVVRLPAVMPSSGTRSVSAMTSLTRSTGTRSSSAAAWVSSARGPWPSSTFPLRAVIVPSSFRKSRAVTGAASAQASGAATETRSPDPRA